MTARKDGVLGFAHEMLDYDPRIDVAVKFVLRNTLVVENLSIARQYMGGNRVWPFGGMSSNRGAMVGGSKRKMSIAFGGQFRAPARLRSRLQRLRSII